MVGLQKRCMCNGKWANIIILHCLITPWHQSEKASGEREAERERESAERERERRERARREDREKCMCDEK